MRKVIVLLSVLFCMSLFAGGCEEILTGIGIGVAGSETLDSWEENLEAKGIELTQEYEKAIARMQAATDPNELVFEIEKIQQIQIAKAANLGALTTIREVKSNGQTGDGKGGYLNLLHGLIPIAVGYAGIEIRKRHALEKKRQAEKAGRELALREIAAMETNMITAPIVKEIMYRDIGNALKE